MDKFKVKINTGLKLVVWGIPLGLVLRLLVLNLCFDMETGFYSDGGVTVWLSLLLPGLLAGAGAWCFYKNRAAFQRRDRGIARGPGIFAGFSGGVLLVVGVFMLMDLSTVPNAFETTVNTGLHLTLAVLSLIFGALQSFTALCLCAGRDPFKKAPLLYLPGVAWGMALLVTVYVYYARSSSTPENIFSLLGTGFMLLALFYLCAALGRCEPRDLRRMFGFGGLSAVLLIPYDVTNILWAMLGRTYFGELPAIYALGRLSVCMFIFAFILSAYRTNVDKDLDGSFSSRD